MADIKKAIGKVVGAFTSLSQTEQARRSAEKSITPGMPELLRYAAAQGAVLLENDGTLPLRKGTRVALFGRVQKDWFYTGYGSGGDVNKPYAVNLLDGMRGCSELSLDEETAAIYESWCERNPVDHGYWGNWPRFYPEMPVTNDFVRQASARAEVAVAVIGRSSGEDRENVLEKGSYYITDEELDMLCKLTTHFNKTVVLLNIGSVMDMSFLKELPVSPSAVMIVWQGGMESGNAVSDLLCGRAAPCGRLADTIVTDYKEYPCADFFGGKDYNYYTEDIYVGYRYFETFNSQAVQYPFGYGLSYTDFKLSFEGAEDSSEGVDISLTVKNTGECASRQVAQLYIEKPCGLLGNPRRELCGFAKTGELQPGETQQLTVRVPLRAFASYDEKGLTGYESAYVIEKGVYRIALGENVRDAVTVYETDYDETRVLEQLSQCSAPREEFQALGAVCDERGRYIRKQHSVRAREYSLRDIILEKLPADIPQTQDKGIKLIDVKQGKSSLEEFVAQLSLKELEAISRGHYVMGSDLGVPGNAGCFGGVLESLRSKGVPAVTTTDGPSGIRLSASCSLIPIGTLLACSFDEEMVETLLTKLGEEMAEKQTDVILAPGMNIHRTPLCGRNFEYFSEDPYLTGKLAAAYVRGIQKNGKSACPKHFVCNNQEYNRAGNDSRLSERALREIYLRGFEICVKESAPKNIMTSYNLINGVWGHYNYELCTRILRDEWGYKGNVMTDWWMKKSASQEFPSMCDQAYRVRAQVDVLMPGGSRVALIKRPDGTLLKTYGKKDGITLGEMQRTAMNVLRFVMESTAMERI